MGEVIATSKLSKKLTFQQQASGSHNMFMERFPDALLQLNLEGAIVYVNSLCERLFGYYEGELREMTFVNLIAPKERDLVYWYLNQAAEGEDQEFDVPVLHKLGHRINITLRVFPISEQGHSLGLYVVAMPSSASKAGSTLEIIPLNSELCERKQFIENLQQSEKRYQRLVEEVSDAVIICAAGKLLYSNHAAIQLLGATSKDDFSDRSFYDFVHPDDLERVRSQLVMVEQGEELDMIEVQLQSIDAKIKTVELKGMSTYYQEKPAVSVIVRDISERKETQQLLLHSEKLSMAGQLAAGIAHEIRNPLTSLKGFLQLIQLDGSEKQEYYAIMASELDRIESIVSELLTLAKPNSVCFKERNLIHLLKHVVTLLETKAIIQNIQITTIYEVESAFIHCDENQLKQAFINFIKNGIEAMKDGGEMVIRLSKKTDASYLISIIDQGCGIPSEQMGKLGDPFYTTKEMGTGLGLMMSYKIIDNHQGKIHIDSEVKMGTAVHVELPMLIKY